jgi:uncharacterized protein (DUF3820 family)
MPFGKYKGQKLANVPAGYLLWLYDQKKLFGDLKNYVEENTPVLKFQKEQAEKNERK